MPSLRGARAAGLAVAALLLLLVALPTRGDGPVLQNGDLFVASASFVDGFGNTVGGIWRVRDGTATLFCASPVASDDPGFWNVPNSVIVDSNGRVAFLAPIGGGNTGLLRCSLPGAPAERIAAFRQHGAIPAGWSEAFPGTLFNDLIGSLHVLKQRVIADDLRTLLHPQVHNADAYEFVAQLPTGVPAAPLLNGLFRYDTATGLWLGSDALPDVPPPYGNLASVVAHDDSLWMLNDGTLRRTRLPLEIGISGTVGGTDFKLDFGLFGGTTDLINPIVDNTQVANVGGLCGSHDPIPDEVPLDFSGGKAPLEAGKVIYDEHTGNGLVLLTTYGPMPGPYMTQVNSALLNDDPSDDNQGYFHDYFNGCIPTKWLQFEPILPYTPAAGPAFGNVTDVIATAPGGMVGTQFYGDQVVRILPGDHVFPIVSLYRPTGIAAYPAVVPSLGTVVYLTIHSPVDVMVTDAGGRRIGVDPATGSPVNDFGPDAFDSGAGEPRVLAIRNPAPGPYSVDVVGSGTGPYTIDISTADVKTGASDRIRTTGNATPGSRTKPDFTLGPGSTLAFTNSPRTWVSSTGADANPCSRVAPCRSLSAAVGHTAVDGEIVVLDSAGYGPVVITRPLSIVAAPGVHAGISVPAGTGIVVNPGFGTVSLRGLTVNGTGGAVGIDYQSGNALYVERTTVENFTSAAINAAPNAKGAIYMQDVRIRASAAGGVFAPSATAPGPLTVTIDRAQFENNATGVLFSGNDTSGVIRDSELAGGDVGLMLQPSVTGATATVQVRRSTLSANGTAGIEAGNGAAGTSAAVRLFGTQITGNGTGLAVQTGGSATATDTTIAANGVGLSLSGGGTAVSFSDNRLLRNGVDGAFSSSTTKQ